MYVYTLLSSVEIQPALNKEFSKHFIWTVKTIPSRREFLHLMTCNYKLRNELPLKADFTLGIIALTISYIFDTFTMVFAKLLLFYASLNCI